MEPKPTKMELFQQGYNCCQIISAYLSDLCGLYEADIKDSFDVMCRTCGGTCSTLRGGSYFIRAYADKQGYGRDWAREKIDVLYDLFREKHGSILCKELSGADVMVCAAYVDTVVETVSEMLSSPVRASTHM